MPHVTNKPKFKCNKIQNDKIKLHKRIYEFLTQRCEDIEALGKSMDIETCWMLNLVWWNLVVQKIMKFWNVSYETRTEGLGLRVNYNKQWDIRRVGLELFNSPCGKLLHSDFHKYLPYSSSKWKWKNSCRLSPKIGTTGYPPHQKCGFEIHRSVHTNYDNWKDSLGCWGHWGDRPWYLADMWVHALQC